MPNDLRFDGRVAIVTGAGNGLGRSHALLLASRGAKVVVNDLGGSATGQGKSSAAADKVVSDIKAAGGEAVANYDSVEDGGKIVQCALDHFGKIDIVINNAGILRDVSFHKMSEEDWDLIYRVHVLGGFRVSHAAFSRMRDQGYGRIIFTASAAGIYGNFGQANYSMAKLGLVGLSNTLAIEGRKKNIFSNTIAPIAGSRLTETVLPKELIDALKPEYVSPLVAYLASESCQETGGLFEVGGGFVAKLRWERAEGQLYKLSKVMTPEHVQEKWSAITSFEKSTHPTDITASMAPILDNLSSAKGKGGNEFIDVDQALGYQFPEVKSSYDERELAIYALGVGAAKDPLDTSELQYVYELHPDGFRALPTFGVVPVIRTMLRTDQQVPGLNFGFERILHGEQRTELRRPLPTKANLTHRTKVKDIWDKGKNAVIVYETRSYDSDTGEELIYNEGTMLVRGAGGWGGERGPSGDANPAPDRPADVVVEEKTAFNQAILYRLSGDWNPLHVDPNFAKAFGMDRPILHGLCTFGYVGRHVVKSVLSNDPQKFKSITVRFADVVFPGETLRTEIWKEGDTKAIVRCKVIERDKVVISNAAIEFYKEVPTAKIPAKTEQPATAKPQAQAQAPAPAPVSAPAPAANSGPSISDAVWGIGFYVEQNPNLAAKVKNVFQFKLTDPATAFVIDLKNGSGKVYEGTDPKPDCTLEMSTSDFMGMASGTLDAQKLYFGGKLKISGNIMASQKLQFLKDVDQKKLQADAEKMGKRPPSATGSSSAPQPAPAPVSMSTSTSTSTSSAGPTISDAVWGIGFYVEQNPNLAAKVKNVFQFKLTDPAAAFVIDLKNGSGKVYEGTDPKPDCTLEMSTSDFMGMASGTLDAQKLYFGGKLKISGNIMASQKLQFLKDVDQKKLQAEAEKQGKLPPSKGGSTTAATSAATPAAQETKQQTPAVFEALAKRLQSDSGIAKEVNAVIQFVVRDPQSEWIVDLRDTASVKRGKQADAATTITITEEDLVELAKGSATPLSLFMHGKLRVDGIVAHAHRLTFFKELI